NAQRVKGKVHRQDGGSHLCQEHGESSIPTANFQDSAAARLQGAKMGGNLEEVTQERAPAKRRGNKRTERELSILQVARGHFVLIFVREWAVHEAGNAVFDSVFSCAGRASQDSPDDAKGTALQFVGEDQGACVAGTAQQMKQMMGELRGDYLRLPRLGSGQGFGRSQVDGVALGHV